MKALSHVSYQQKNLASYKFFGSPGSPVKKPQECEKRVAFDPLLTSFFVPFWPAISPAACPFFVRSGLPVFKLTAMAQWLPLLFSNFLTRVQFLPAPIPFFFSPTLQKYLYKHPENPENTQKPGADALCTNVLLDVSW